MVLVVDRGAIFRVRAGDRDPYDVAVDAQPLPMALDRCGLSDAELDDQARRYSAIGAGAVVLSREARRISLRVAAEIEPDAVAETLEIERRCCPFFELAWLPDDRILTIAVSDARDEPALTALAGALGLA
jgi:hypothetical protein